MNERRMGLSGPCLTGEADIVQIILGCLNLSGVLLCAVSVHKYAS
jgi:hypothetical protein